MNRIAAAVLLVLVAPLAAQVQPPKRFNIEADTDQYSQATPQDTLRSVLKAIDAKRINYLMAQLADPAFVDEKVKQSGDKFDAVVADTQKKLDADPQAVRDLRKLLAEGEWKVEGNAASASVKSVRDRQAYFKKIGDRWYFENRVGPSKGTQS